MWYIEWYVCEYSGDTYGRFAVYFRSEEAAQKAMRWYLLDHSVDGFKVKYYES